MKTQQITITAEINANLRAVTVFYPATNKREPALFDSVNGLILGSSKNALKPYHPVGGRYAINDIINGKDGYQGLVVGCQIKGFQAYHCHGETYRITPIE